MTVVGVDACPKGWVAIVIDDSATQITTFEAFDRLADAYSDADRILVDIPIGLPENDRRQCDVEAKDLLGSRGSSVFYAPCSEAIEHDDHAEASQAHRDNIGHGLSRQAHSIAPKIRQVSEVVEDDDNGYVRESHPELCFAALNDQPIAYSKTTDTGRAVRMKLLTDELDGAKSLYHDARKRFLLKEVRRDDVLDSIVLAVAARNGADATVPEDPTAEEPRIYYPAFSPPTVPVE